MTAFSRSAAAASLLAILSAIVVTAQVTRPPRDARRPEQQPAATGTAEISGIVMLVGSSQPARRARVNVSGAELRGGRTATTDDNGRFLFTALPAGRYTLSVSKPGHILVTYGQRQPGRPGTQIQLSEGQKFRADLQIPKGSVITGTVLDEHGEPAAQTPVRVMRFVMANGQRTVGATRMSSADDRGIYRVFGLMPGEYVVCATPRNTGMSGADRVQVELRTLTEAATRVRAEQAQNLRDRIAAIQGSMPYADEETPPGYAPVCYPGTTSPSAATPVVLGVSEERTAIDFQLQLTPVAAVEGVVMNSTGAPIGPTTVTLTDGSPGGTSILNLTARPDAEGRFRIGNVPPGQYRVTARSTLVAPRPPGARGRGAVTAPGRAGGPRPQPVTLWAAADISVDGSNLSNVMLALQQGVSVSGQVTFEGTTEPAPTDLTRIRVNISPVGPNPFGGASSAPVDATGRFTVPSVPPGRYRLNAAAPGGWVTESAIIGGQDALDFPVDIKGSQNIAGVTITLTNRSTELTGIVTDEKNQPAVDHTLIIFPADSRYWAAGASRRIRTGRPATDGTFTFRGLPPGEYRIATPVDLEPGAISDPAVLQQLEGASMRVTLQPGETKVQNIRVSGG